MDGVFDGLVMTPGASLQLVGTGLSVAVPVRLEREAKSNEGG